MVDDGSDAATAVSRANRVATRGGLARQNRSGGTSRDAAPSGTSRDADGASPGSSTRHDGAGADEYAHPVAGDFGAPDDSFEDEATEEDPQHRETGTGKRLEKVAIVLNPSKFADQDSFKQRITEVIERIEGAEVVFY